jgi:hypothetical protein
MEMNTGLIKLSVFESDDIRVATKRAADGTNADRAGIEEVKELLQL